MIVRASAFAPATVANVGPGFDILGLALEGPGDTVHVRRRAEPGVEVVAITGDDGRLPRAADQNAAAIAAGEVLRMAAVSWGVELTLEKGLPIGSGMGSSSASAVAGAVAANALLTSGLSEELLLAACIEAEAVVAGRHADNVAPALLGGLVAVLAVDPPRLRRLPLPQGYVTTCTPDVEIRTADARRVLPERVSRGVLVDTTVALTELLTACYADDLVGVGAVLGADWATKARLPLIPGGGAAIAAAREAGAVGASISGSGPTIFALSQDEAKAQQIAAAMISAFADHGHGSTAHVSQLRNAGARVTHRETA